MTPRVAGAALALLAAVLLVASAVGFPAGWWSGHPVRNGEPMHKKDVTVSLVSTVGCNTGGDGTCEPLPMTSSFDAVRYVELGASGILVLVALILAGVTIAGSETRKKLGMVVIALAVICVVIAIAMIAMPKMKISNITLPMGPGLFVFFGAMVCAVVGSLFAMRPTPKLMLQPPRQSFAPALGPPPSAQPVDVLALLHGETPPVAEASRPPPSPGGQLAGPAGALVPQHPAPYAVPVPAPYAPPVSASYAPPVPAPLPLPTPAPFSAPQPPPPEPRPRTGSIAPPLPPDRQRSKGSGNVPAIADPRPRSASVAPPPPPDARPRPPSRPPPAKSPTAEARTKAASIAPPTGFSPSAPARTKGPSVPPPAADARPKLPGHKPTTVSAVVPPPPGALPLANTTLPVRADTDPTDHLETMDRDAMTLARDAAAIGDSTDASVALPPGEDHTDLAVRPATITENVPTLGVEKVSSPDIQTSAKRKATPSELLRAVARESQSEIDTIAREKISSRDLAIGDSTNPAGTPAPVRTAIQELGEAPTQRAQSVPAKIPVSTASESLPPPKKGDIAASGPTPACPQCEAPMAWVEEHLRFYCKSCRMYF